jgi:hypothetical protein
VTLKLRKKTLVLEAEPALASHEELLGKDVIAEIATTERWVADATERSYREPVPGKSETVFRCTALEPAPPRETWLPRDVPELQWVLAWSARLSLAGSIVAVVFG